MSTSDESPVQPQPDSPLASSETALSLTVPSEGAGFWIRALARVIDAVVHYVPTLAIGILLGVIIGIGAALTGVSPDPLVQRVQSNSFADFALPLLGYLVYNTMCEGLHGATLGKLICGLIVVREDGSPCGLGAALGRSLAFLVDALVFGVVAGASMSTSPLQQRLGDKWVHTVVAKRQDLSPVQRGSGLVFVVVFLCAVVLDTIITGIPLLLRLVR